MNSIENTLKQMTKPEISTLKHEDMLAYEIMKAKNRTALSAWWLSIPLYLIACLAMKSYFMRGTTLISNLNELIKRDPNSSVALFIILPLFFAVLNFYSVYKMYSFVRSVKPLFYTVLFWIHLVTIFVCIGIIIIYFI